MASVSEYTQKSYGVWRAMIRDVEVRDADAKGRGVFALRAFETGEFIFRRRHARVVKLDELDSLSDDDRMHLCELD